MNLFSSHRNAAANQRDFYAVQSFLSACYGGPFITLINRLTDVYPLYEYPATQLPNAGQNLGNQGNVFLSAFEFYFYHFFNLPLRRQNVYQGVNQSNVVTDSLYPILVEDYLNAFLPVDATNQSKLFSQNHTSPGSFHHQMQQIKQQQETLQSLPFDGGQKVNSTPCGRHSLLRKDFSFASMQSQHSPDVSTIGTAFTSPIQGLTQQESPLGNNKISKGATSEIWRSETLSKILIAFWLESYVGRLGEANYPNTGHLTHPTTFSTPLPSNELLRCVRMFIKHAHYFANACKEGGPYVPSSLRYVV